MTGQTTQWLLDAVGRSEPGAKAKLQGVEASDALDEIWEELADVTGTSDSDIARMVAKAYFLPVADIEAAEPTAVRFVPAEVARRLRVFPLRENYRDLVVATCDPTNLDTEQAIAFASGRSVKFEIASPRTLDLAIAATYAPENVVDTFLGGLDFEDDDSLALVEDEEADQIDQSDIESGPVVKLANLILRDAISRGASDIHIQPTDKGGVIRFRVDGLLRNYMRMPQAAHNRVVSRIKVIGGLDIADHLRPQDGRARVAVAGRNFDLRISTVPTRAAEKAVIRVLDTQGAPLLDEVGFGSDELERYRKLLSLRDGIVVVTGPTGSGKTTTLYAALRELATEDVNIMTIEDPIEYDLPGITQMQVETKQGLTFATALRAMLRQDPDIILVGEIRDKETADMAVQAAMTGHLVLATLHTIDAAAIVRRLIDIGLTATSVADALRGAVAQRLARKLCEHCATEIEDDIEPEERRLAFTYGVTPTTRAVGCDKCDGTGYRGRVPVTEVLIIDEETLPLVAREAPTAELRDAARASGMTVMRESGLDLVNAGVTTLAELDRVLGEEIEAEPDDGASFTVELPAWAAPAASSRPSVAVPQAAPQTAPQSLPPQIQRVTGAMPPEDNRRALIVDDDATTRAVTRALLSTEGFAIAEAADGTDAVKALKADPVWDLVVLDLDMPLLDGRDVLRIIRSSPSTAALPVVVLTGTPDERAEFQVLELGADDYIRKPIDAPQFLGRVRAVLRRAGSARFG